MTQRTHKAFCADQMASDIQQKQLHMISSSKQNDKNNKHVAAINTEEDKGLSNYIYLYLYFNACYYTVSFFYLKQFYSRRKHYIFPLQIYSYFTIYNSKKYLYISGRTESDVTEVF